MTCKITPISSYNFLHAGFGFGTSKMRNENIMGLFDIFGFGSNINDLVEEARTTQNATIIDVRTPAEFKQSHIEGALNIPVDQIQKVEQAVKDPDTPLYLYCASGARSGSAARFLQSQGFTQVTNMGGIGSWRGEVVKGSK